MNWFKSCRCVEDVKQQYKELIKQWHPDVCSRADATKTMSQINNEYEAAFNRLKNTHRSAAAEETYYQKETNETFDEYRDILEALIHYPGIVIEVIGSWLWVSGETKPIKEELKKLGFQFSAKKISWYFHFEPYHKKHGKKFTMEELRQMWGSREVETKERQAIGV